MNKQEALNKIDELREFVDSYEDDLYEALRSMCIPTYAISKFRSGYKISGGFFINKNNLSKHENYGISVIDKYLYIYEY